MIINSENVFKLNLLFKTNDNMIRILSGFTAERTELPSPCASVGYCVSCYDSTISCTVFSDKTILWIPCCSYKLLKFIYGISSILYTLIGFMWPCATMFSREVVDSVEYWFNHYNHNFPNFPPSIIGTERISGSTRTSHHRFRHTILDN